LGNVIRKRILSFPDLLFVRGLAKAMQDPKRRFDEREFVRKGEGYLFTTSRRTFPQWTRVGGNS